MRVTLPPLEASLRRPSWPTVAALALGVAIWGTWIVTVGRGVDLDDFYRVTLDHPYARPWGDPLAFVYSPAFAQLLQPFRLLPQPVFDLVWRGLAVAALFALTGPWAVLFTLAPPVVGEVRGGNIHLFLGLAIVLGFRRPWLWSFVLLTKVTPGVGLIWFAVRREWRALGIALGATAAIATISAILAPHLWAEWVGLLTTVQLPGQNPALIPLPLLPRLAAAAALVAWGASQNRPWVVPVGATLALPALWMTGLSMLVAVVPVTLREIGLRNRPPESHDEPARPMAAVDL